MDLYEMNTSLSGNMWSVASESATAKRRPGPGEMETWDMRLIMA
jgi:hypothetical protein